MRIRLQLLIQRAREKIKQGFLDSKKKKIFAQFHQTKKCRESMKELFGNEEIKKKFMNYKQAIQRKQEQPNSERQGDGIFVKPFENKRIQDEG